MSFTAKMNGDLKDVFLLYPILKGIHNLAECNISEQIEVNLF
jgi:hypothetical protein